MSAILAPLLPVAMMVMMFALGLRLRPVELAEAARVPRALGAGLMVQMLGLPALAFGIGQALDLSAPLLAGLMLVAAAPGGVSSNYAAYLARGQVGLSVAMTLVTSALAPLSLPLVLFVAGVALPETGAGLWKISGGMIAVALVPMGLGMALARFAPALRARVSAGVDRLAKIMFLAMVLATFAQNWGAMRAGFAGAGLAVILLAVLGPALAGGAARLARLDGAQTRTILCETALQNVAITMFVAGKLLGDPTLAIPGLIYAVMMNIVALLVIGAGGVAGVERAPMASRNG